MSSWRDQILREFTPKVSRLTLVADPDELLLEEGILEGIRERGFELIPFDDHIAFRYAYESKFRSRWDRGEETDLVVVLRSHASDFSGLPYDLLQAGRKLSFNLGDIFPNLSYPVVSALDRGDLDTLYQTQERYTPGELGDNATKDFVLRHVFEIATELIKEPHDLLRILIRRHYRGQRIPEMLDERLIQLLRNDGYFTDWPLEEIVPNRQAFFGFLQERWRFFLDYLAGRGRELQPVYNPQYPGPLNLPFEHDDVKVYIDNLFTEGYLIPEFHPETEKLKTQWVAVGLKTASATDRKHQFCSLWAALEKSVPGEHARYQEWLTFARKWAELTVLRFEEDLAGDHKVVEQFENLRGRMDNAFFIWIRNRYSGLYSQPAMPPVMIHHIPRYLARMIEAGNHEKLALVVLDGLSYDQWLVVRNTLKTEWPHFRLDEDAVFAWIPTFTAVSRQALFAGKPPFYFPGSIYATDKESSLWALFWADQGLGKDGVTYLNVAGDEDLSMTADALSHPKCRAAGIVVRKIDKIMHGMELGTAGMHNQVCQWTKTGYLAGLFSLLLNDGFAVYLTSDHGNIEAVGCGLPAEGVTAELRGSRARIYSDQLLKKRIKDRFPGAVEWEPVGLPEGYLPLLAPGRAAFIREGDKAVCHGGICLEEVIVPFVRIDHIKGMTYEPKDAGGFQPTDSA